MNTDFKCPHCGDEGEKVDDRYFQSERIQGDDNLNADPLSRIYNKIELWYCLWCGNYFRAYFKLEKITKLGEEK